MLRIFSVNDIEIPVKISSVGDIEKPILKIFTIELSSKERTELKEIPSELKEFNLYIREGLPAYMSYFATSKIGQLYYWNSEYDKAFSAFNAAVEILERSPPHRRDPGSWWLE